VHASLAEAKRTPVPGAWRKLRQHRTRICDVAILAAVLIAPVSGLMTIGDVQIGINMGLYMILAVGLNVVVGYAGLLDLGYIAFYAIGSYTYAFLASPQFDLHLPLLAVMPIAAVVAGLFGMAFGAPTLRLRGDYLAIVTLGFGEIVQIVANNADGLTNGPQGIYDIDPASVLGIQLDEVTGYYYLVVGVGLVVVWAISRLSRSSVGRAWEAIREDEDAARAAGIDTTRMKLLAFMIGAMVAGLAGPIFAAQEAFVSPVSFSLDQSILVLAMVILGGMGNIRGVLLGAAILTLVPELLRSTAAARFIVVGAIMTLVMILRPGGLLPRRGPAALAEVERPAPGSAVPAAQPFVPE
jgi:branched-chain amino acid transport system permease protein